jgi:hypothetical protein
MTGLEFIRQQASSLHPAQLLVIAVVAGCGTAFAVAKVVVECGLGGWAAIVVSAAVVVMVMAAVLAVLGSRRVQGWVTDGKVR